MSVVIPSGQKHNNPPPGAATTEVSNNFEIPYGFYYLETLYMKTVIIELFDQFGEPLGNLYDNAVLKEQFTGTGYLPGGGGKVSMERAGPVTNGQFNDPAGRVRYITFEDITPPPDPLKYSELAAKWKLGMLEIPGITVWVRDGWRLPNIKATPYYQGRQEIWVDEFQLKDPWLRTVDTYAPDHVEVFDQL